MTEESLRSLIRAKVARSARGDLTICLKCYGASRLMFDTAKAMAESITGEGTARWDGSKAGVLIIKKP